MEGVHCRCPMYCSLATGAMVAMSSSRMCRMSDGSTHCGWTVVSGLPARLKASMTNCEQNSRLLPSEGTVMVASALRHKWRMARGITGSSQAFRAMENGACSAMPRWL